MSSPPLSCRQTVSISLPPSTRVAPGSAGCVRPATSRAVEPVIQATPTQRSDAAIGGLRALGQPRVRASADAAAVPRPRVVYSTTSEGGTSGAYNPPPYGPEIRARAVRELLDKEGAVSREALRAKEQEIHDRLSKNNSRAEFATHSPEAAGASLPVSVPRAIANALHSGIEGARRVAQQARFAPRAAWGV